MIDLIRLRWTALLALVLSASVAHAQPEDPRPPDSLDFDPVPEGRSGRIFNEGLPFRLDFGIQGKMSVPLSGRLQVVGGFPTIHSALFSFAVTEGRDSLGTFLSLNPLISGVAYLGGQLSPTVGFILLLPQALPNISFEVPIVEHHLGVTVGERTDYFWKDKVFRIHTETQMGLRLYAPQIMIEGLYVIPHTGSVMEHKPYIGVGVAFRPMQM